MSTLQQFVAALFLALALSGVSSYILFYPISVRYTESERVDRNWERLSSLAVRHLEVAKVDGPHYGGVLAVITRGAASGDRLKLAASLRVPDLETRFEHDDQFGGPALIVERPARAFSSDEVNQILNAIQFSTDNRRPEKDISRLIELRALGLGDHADQQSNVEKKFKFLVAVSGQNDVPEVRLQVREKHGDLIDASEVAVSERKPLKFGDLFAAAHAADPDRYDYFTAELAVRRGELRVSGEGLPERDFAGAPLAWSETLPYTQREEYFLDVAGKHVTLQSRNYARVSQLLMGKSSEPWGLTYLPPATGVEPDLLTIRVNDHGDGAGHAAAESSQEIRIRFTDRESGSAVRPRSSAPQRKRKRVFVEVFRLEHRRAEAVLPVLRDSLPAGSSIEAKQNTLVFKGSPDALQKMRAAAQRLDVPPSEQ